MRLYLITWMMHLILIGGFRISFRITKRYINGKDYKKKPTLIVGAGQGGSLLIRQMLEAQTWDLNPYLQLMMILKNEN